MLQQRRDSKSFDSAPLYRQENDITNESNDNCNGVSGTIDDRKKIKLPTPPVPSSAIPSRSPETKPTTRFIIKSDSSSNQCTDDETNNKADDANGLANLIEPIGEHKTTLGEAEIQNAVEAAAVIFKKVVLQRRAAKTALEKDDGKFCFSSWIEYHAILIDCRNKNININTKIPIAFNDFMISNENEQMNIYVNVIALNYLSYGLWKRMNAGKRYPQLSSCLHGYHYFII